MYLQSQSPSTIMDEAESFLSSRNSHLTFNDEPFDPYALSPGPTQHVQPIPITGRRVRQLNIGVVFSTAVVVIGTAGIATTLVIWLISHKVQHSFTDVWREGAFLLDEGERTEGGLRSGRLLGLAISSTAVSLHPFSIDVECSSIWRRRPYCLSLHQWLWAYMPSVWHNFGSIRFTEGIPASTLPSCPHLCSTSL